MKYQSSTLEITIAAVIIATMLALSVLVLVTQQEASAVVSMKPSFKQTQVNRCSDSAKCSNTGTITVGSGGGHSSPGGGGGGGHSSPGHGHPSGGGGEGHGHPAP